MYGEGQLILTNLQLPCSLVDQLLQSTKRAQPATEHATPPEQDAPCGEHPEHEDHRVTEEQLPAEVLHHRMHEGQHIDHRQLPQGIPANEHHGEHQIASAQPVQESRIAGKTILQEQNGHQQQQRRAQHGHLEALGIPDVHPHRSIGLLDGGQFFSRRQWPLDIVLRDLVGHLETGEHAIHRTGLATHQQLQRPVRPRIEGILVAHDENCFLGKRRHAVQIDIIQTLKIEIAETDQVTKLAQLYAVENPTTHITRALEGIQPIAKYRDGLLTLFQLPHQVVVLAVAKQIAPDGRSIEMRHIQIDEGVIFLLGTCLINTFGLTANKGLVDLPTGQQQPANRPIAGQGCPIAGAVDVLANRGRLALDRGMRLDQS